MKKMDNKIKYAVQLAMLQKLLNNKVISKIEYSAIKNTIKKKYKVLDVA